MSKTAFLKSLLLIVLTNYAAQIPYYIHQYYAPHHFLPSLLGSVLLSMTLAWFLLAYWKLAQGKGWGYWLMLAFLTVEFLFYLQTQVSQLLISHQVLLHVYKPDGILLFVVFGIGYINFLAAVYFIVFLRRHKQLFTSVGTPS